MTLNFESRGHVRIELRDADDIEDKGDFVSNIKTDRNGDIWLYCENCPGHNDNSDTGADYEPDKDYTFSITKNDGGTTTWEFLEDGSTIYSESYEMSDWNSVSIFTSNSEQQPEYTIKEVSISG